MRPSNAHPSKSHAANAGQQIMQSAGRSSTHLQTREPNEGSVGRAGIQVLNEFQPTCSTDVAGQCLPSLSQVEVTTM